ncbi:hypothetical protein FOA52_015336 [Chlamydomonas sp. UWO 241]|nr:hypothetical protein FOA52_015336 [Chlamydomonas sp. UWO 241]
MVASSFRDRLSHEVALEEVGGAYTSLRVIGSGTYGMVFAAVDVSTGETVAIKFLEKGKTRYIEAEIVNHSGLFHPHVIGFRSVFLTAHYVCLVLDYSPRGTLSSYIKKQQLGRLPEDGQGGARWFFQQLMFALDYCHRKGVYNRDVKLDNTLLTDKLVLKLSDFGFSKSRNDSNPKTQVGTPFYMAPEVFTASSNPNRPYDGRAADIWSAGVMLYAMLTGSFPFMPDDTPDGYVGMHLSMVNQMKAGGAVYPEHLVTHMARDLLTRMFEPTPAKRIDMAGVMSHPWFLATLPGGADTMNDAYLAAALPPGRMGPDETRAVMAQARAQHPGGGGGGGGAGSSGSWQDGSGSGSGGPCDGHGLLDDAFIDDIIDEDAHEYEGHAYGGGGGFSPTGGAHHEHPELRGGHTHGGGAWRRGGSGGQRSVGVAMECTLEEPPAAAAVADEPGERRQ